MIITHTLTNSGSIARATTDDGRIAYSPSGDAIQIDEREVYCGNYLDQDGRKVGPVSTADRAAMLALIRAVDAQNETIAVGLRNAAFAQQDACERMTDADLSRKVRGFADGAR